jgi:hypothetical protein
MSANATPKPAAPAAHAVHPGDQDLHVSRLRGRGAAKAVLGTLGQTNGTSFFSDH